MTCSPPARDHLQRQDVVAHHTQPRGRAADAADRQRAADRQVEVVGAHGRGAPVGQRDRDHLAPGRPGVDDHPVALDRVNSPEPSHVGHDAVARLGAAEHRMPPPLGREPAALPGGPANCRCHVLGRRGEQDGIRCLGTRCPKSSAAAARVVTLGRGRGSGPMA